MGPTRRTMWSSTLLPLLHTFMGMMRRKEITPHGQSNINKLNAPWKLYSKERLAAKKPPPELVELEGRRRYFDDEDELMKVYSARKTTTLLQLLLWPDTTIKIICLNVGINLPNGAYKELVEEMDLHGLELRIHDKLSKSAAITLEEGQEIPFLLRAENGESIGALLSRGKNEKKEKVAAIYFVSTPYIIYAGQALNSNVHGHKNLKDPVVDYQNNKPPSHPNPKIVPIGIVRAEERYKWEFHLQMCALIASLLRLRNCINPSDFSAQSHPLCINRQVNSSFVDQKSWGIIHGYLMKKFLVDVYLGPKASDQ
ncbi:uncharacterized protein LOC110854280 [Folsomia candida]|uniref:uncharacterized protein LOC110854280 n=1 Tax=Folsomia candida TaxID=158441 RepID=UPI000B905618|nr:uncharacterized protein LOC110854280 [Folsomia candida]XP_035710946.1 uncharacterized protein LOC110854280 [Folsomia candida]